jgi:hypothetical protein
MHLYQLKLVDMKLYQSKLIHVNLCQHQLFEEVKSLLIQNINILIKK